MKKKDLFRTEALRANEKKLLGEIILVRPLSFTFLTVLAIGVASILIGVSIVGTYTKRIALNGQLVPDSGMIKVYPTQPGVVVQKLVVEGQEVKQGDILFVLSSERQNATSQFVQETISREVKLREESLVDEKEKTKKMQQEEQEALQRKLADLQSEVDKVDSEIVVQQNRVALADESFARYTDLLHRGFVPKEQMQQKNGELLDQRSRLQALERDRLGVTRELGALRSELASLGLKQQNQLASIDRTIASIKQELTESEAKRRQVISAQENGFIAAVSAELGQNVDPSRLLVSIIPSGSALQAQLFAPSKAIGFITRGDTVMLRYQAYPFQKFGHAKGEIVSISEAALAPTEINSNLLAKSAKYDEPLYKITVKIPAQTVQAYGKSWALHAGMLLDADVLLDKRPIYEWVLEPLFSVTGRL